jgi:hypothetical protein
MPVKGSLQHGLSYGNLVTGDGSQVPRHGRLRRLSVGRAGRIGCRSQVGLGGRQRIFCLSEGSHVTVELLPIRRCHQRLVGVGCVQCALIDGELMGLDGAGRLGARSRR